MVYKGLKLQLPVYLYSNFKRYLQLIELFKPSTFNLDTDLIVLDQLIVISIIEIKICQLI